jgi:tRNA(fMet)-specific endonuclease VapC
MMTWTLSKQGRLIGPDDMLIASIANSNHLILVTHNAREFNRVSQLRIED